MSTLKTENTEIKMELKETKKLLRTALQINLQKDLKLQQMVNQINLNGIEFNPNFVAGEFDRFRKFFSDRQLSSLRGLDFDRKTDSTFLKCALEFVYKDNLSALANKTVTGKIQNVAEGGILKRLTLKEPITPQKVEILKEIFNERISSLPDNNCLHMRKERFHTVLAKVVDRLRIDRLKSPRLNKKLVF